MERRVTPPPWINKEFIEFVLEKKKKCKKVTTDNVDVKYASVEGTGYASLIFRVVAFLKDEDNKEMKKESLIVKVALDTGPLKDLLDKWHAFRTESVILHEVMPQIHESLASVEGDEFRPLTAECYHWGRQPKEFLVLQDLSAAGFRMAEAGRPLDYRHCRLVMRAYARLHAASVQLLSRRPHYKEQFSTSLFTQKESIEFFGSIVEKLFCALANELENCPGFEKYSEKYRSLIHGFVDNSFDLFDNLKNKTKLFVLAHGDCWKNNMMYKYEDGNVTDVRLVDLQVSNVSNPASDLQYFLYANASEEVHRHHLDSLLEEYHGTLQSMLRQLGMELEAETYTFEELQLDMDRHSQMGVIFSAMSGFVLTSEKYGAEFSQAFNDPEHSGEALAKVFQNPYSLSYLKYLSPIFESKGLLVAGKESS